jgi:hypothetical protein
MPRMYGCADQVNADEPKQRITAAVITVIPEKEYLNICRAMTGTSVEV